MKNLSNQKGMAAIFTILVIGAAALIMARSAAFLSMSSLNTSFVSDKKSEVEYLTEGCIEESLRRLQFDHNYAVIDLNLMQGDGSCLMTVEGGGDERLIIAEGTITDYHKKITANVVINNDKIIINKWSLND
ncbi:hypothetical protein L6270_05270 [Candidatus Parcubacteria bacterium]|nr:hypothetical protein [Patescibacteria group bacterium]MBU4309370.1 hypothetical protein [Patescibacteria group bacterium]MBU4432101.1 hypothetical protein [Patescibacteria group bacterium]MBU4577731.1 hypothetical protein [Patescibacteria group bacterium]MCG2697416.1 hypothetical protein [Candidatus Parcubacteria bacterium]